MAKPRVRRRASQSRSRATVEKILDSAGKLIAERGSDPVTMTEIAQRSGVVIGALYQYFADKSAIMRALLHRHNSEVDAMLQRRLSKVDSLNGFVRALEASYADYFQSHQEDPLYRGIWSIVQTDAALQAIDIADTLAKADYLRALAEPLYHRVDREALLVTCALNLHLAVSAARFGLAIPDPLRRRSVSVYQKMSREAWMSLEQSPAGRMPKPARARRANIRGP